MSEAGAGGGFGDRAYWSGSRSGSRSSRSSCWHALRLGRAALHRRLAVRRAAASPPPRRTNLLVGIALFGALILLPLYFQLVRGESAARDRAATDAAGARRGARDAARRPADRRDRRPRRDPVRAHARAGGTAAYTQVGADTSYRCSPLRSSSSGSGSARRSCRRWRSPTSPSRARPSARRRARSTSSSGSQARSAPRSSRSSCNARSARPADLGGIVRSQHCRRPRATRRTRARRAFGNTFWVAFVLLVAAAGGAPAPANAHGARERGGPVGRPQGAGP